MNYKVVIQNLSIFKGKTVVVSPLKGGVTNANFKVVSDGKKYVASFGFKSNSLLGIDRNREVYNYQALKGLSIAQKLVKYYSKQDLLLVEYLEGKTVNSSILRQRKNITQISRMLRRVHNGKRFRGVFDPFKITRKYFNVVKDFWMPLEAEMLLNDLKLLETKLGPLKLNSSCHLDLMPLNILINKDKMYLLDWEYSSVSDYRFDLGQLSAYAQFNRKQDELLIKSYGAKELTLDQLNAAKAVMVIREIGWSAVQVKYSKLKVNYKKYITGHLKTYHRIRKQILLP